MPALYPNNIGGDVTLAIGVQPAAKAAAAAFSLKGTGLDCQGLSSIVAIVAAGAVDAGTFTLDAKLQHSDTDVDGNYVDCATNPQNSAVAIPQITAINTKKALEIDVTGLKRFVRMVHTLAFGGGGAALGMTQVFLAGGRVIGNPTQ